MAQSVRQSGSDNFGGTTTCVITLNGVLDGSCLEVHYGCEGGTTDPDCTVSDGGAAYTLAIKDTNITNTSNRTGVGIWYKPNVAAGNYTITITNPAAGSASWGWCTAMEITGRHATPLIAGAVGNAQAATGADDTPSVAAAGATGMAAMITAVLNVTGASTNVGIDAISGNSLSWTNVQVRQDGTAEGGLSSDYALAGSSITPSVDWGTLASTYRWNAVVASWEDAASTGNTLTADSGSYSLTGQDAGLSKTSILSAGQGSYSLTGQDIALSYNLAATLTAVSGVYGLTGTEALVDIAMVATQGTYTLTGQDATLTYATLNALSLTADSGTYALTGQDTGFLKGNYTTFSTGTYSLTGQRANLVWSGAPTISGGIVKSMTVSKLKMGL
jgi:hypothetical protein